MAVMLGLLVSISMADAAPQAEYPDLPPAATIRAALETHPDVLGAKSGIKVEEANRSRLEAGPHEFNLRLDSQRRRVRDTGERLREWEVGIERPLRLPNKARIDGELGEQGVGMSKLAYGEALHEAGRTFLRVWFAWMKEYAQAEQWKKQVEVLREQLRKVEKQVHTGDVAKMNVVLAEAALAQAESARAQALTRIRIAANEVTLRFNGLSLPQQPVMSEPQPIKQDFSYWREEILKHNHEIGVARAGARIARLGAAREDADKLPDPTVGIRYASEGSGTERVTGISLSIPLPGQGRSAGAAAAQAHAEVSAQREASVVRKLDMEIANTHAQALADYDNWRRLTTTAERMQRGADLLARAWVLGEDSLSDALDARRDALEAQLAAVLAQLDANESRYRLLLDAHQLWPLEAMDADEDHAHY